MGSEASFARLICGNSRQPDSANGEEGWRGTTRCRLLRLVVIRVALSGPLLPRREEREKRRRVLAFYVGSSLSGFGLYRLAEHRDNRRCREAVD